MIIDGEFAAELPEKAPFRDRAIASFLKFIERKLGVTVIRDVRQAVGDHTLRESLRIARLLQDNGVIKNLGRASTFCDEPRLKAWYATCHDPTNHQVAGASWESDSDALLATLAEALERYIWLTQDDHFISPTQATADDIGKRGHCVAPEDFAGFSKEQRARNPRRQLRKDATYLWIQGTSLLTGKDIHLPAQVVSGLWSHNGPRAAKEPHIRQSTTIGLATWPTQTGARLAGVNEVLEREAYMIMWLNQLTLPRISLAPFAARHASLAQSVEQCERYRLKVHAIRLLTDAPTNAIAVVLEDMSNVAPRFTIGLKAHRSLPSAIQKAMTEALRSRRGCRLWFDAGNVWDVNTPVSEVGHRERLYYWSQSLHEKKLEFMVRGPEIEVASSEWDNDNAEEHLERLIAWCAKKELECISVSLSASGKNPTPWHVEMVVMPTMQPTYLTEATRAFGGTRWQDVPKALGYTPRKKPFADTPHPFS